MSDQTVTDCSGSASEQISSGGSSSVEPERKKAKYEVDLKSYTEADDKLENRLGGILCCAVCLDLPKSAVYQCTNGHLMCACCFTHLLADARLRDETASCPNCRVEIARTLVARNLAVEKAVRELPARCQHCGAEFARSVLTAHEQQMCEQRPVSCMYSVLGCRWRGPVHERQRHQTACTHPTKPGRAVLEALLSSEQQRLHQLSRHDTIFRLLSLDELVCNDIQLKPFRTDDFVQRLFYESARFGAFSYQWQVKARINDDNQRDPSHSCHRRISYQVVLKSRSVSSLTVHYVMLPGPFSASACSASVSSSACPATAGGECAIEPAIYRHEFGDQLPECEYTVLPLAEEQDPAACNRLLAARAINVRLIMFRAVK